MPTSQSEGGDSSFGVPSSQVYQPDNRHFLIQSGYELCSNQQLNQNQIWANYWKVVELQRGLAGGGGSVFLSWLPWAEEPLTHAPTTMILCLKQWIQKHWTEAQNLCSKLHAVSLFAQCICLRKTAHYTTEWDFSVSAACLEPSGHSTMLRCFDS